MVTYTTLASTIGMLIMITGVVIPPLLQNFDMKNFGRARDNVKAVEAAGDGITDDYVAVQAWDSACASTGQFSFPTGVVGPLTFKGPCKAKSVNVIVTGNVIAPLKKDWPNNTDTWIKFQKIDNLVISGAGYFKGQGKAWWDSCRNQNKSTCEQNPTALAFHACNGLKLIGVNSNDSPRNHISINSCNGALISNITINTPKDSPNTDGIDISDTNGVQVIGGNIRTGDDCIAINGGSFNINITNLNCGPGHGISIGSLGRNGATDVVSNIRVVGCAFTSTQNGVRIKTVPGGSGSASNIEFSNIRMTGVDNPILLSQFYCPNRNNSCPDNPHALHINNVSFTDINGTSTHEEAIAIKCSETNGSCGNITLDNINIQPINSSFKVSSTCHNTQVKVVNPVLPPVNCTPQMSILMPLDYIYDDKTPKGASAY